MGDATKISDGAGADDSVEDGGDEFLLVDFAVEVGISETPATPDSASVWLAAGAGKGEGVLAVHEAGWAIWIFDEVAGVRAVWAHPVEVTVEDTTRVATLDDDLYSPDGVDNINEGGKIEADVIVHLEASDATDDVHEGAGAGVDIFAVV